MPLFSKHTAPEQGEIPVLLRRLVALQPNSKRYTKLILIILPHALHLRTPDLQHFLDLVDSALSTGQIDSESVHICLRALQEICYSRKIVPLFFLLSGPLIKDPGRPIANGGFSDVFKSKYGGLAVVIKELRVSTRDLDEVTKRFFNEVVIRKYLSHDNIAPFMGVPGPVGSPPLCMVSQWMGNGTLVEYLQLNPDANHTALFLGVCRGVKYLHSLHIVHADLKGANILIDSSGRPCLTDLGLACFRKDLEAVGDDVSSTSQCFGTWRSMSPELLLPETVIAATRGPSKASDIYALGMVAIEIFSGRLPFPELREPAVINAVLQGVRPERPGHPELSDAIWALVQQCLHHDRAQRPTINFVLNCLEPTVPRRSILTRLANVIRDVGCSLILSGTV